ncbi:hypothetical protein G7048_08895 [Diaphorobacter sp. HDW4B]|uniref:hypothetical protein n=1 Tax=Diaphorobacter sp. HDW4B TaxID=2714925 RepID=UPI00140B8328|nr:hypothetical protein [Diaphorobacter sp. HDW4B]QIL70458.1 hypothetical protein G7048_08895 [Diaphorobacter sp. HDW4B]
MKKQILWATCLLWGLGAGTSVQAQDAANPFIGKWNVEWQGDKKSQEAELEITASGGTWKTATSKRKDPCVGLAAPVEIASASAEKLEFIIKFSTALQGCKDSSTLSLVRDADGKVSGLRGENPLTLTRK